MKQEFIYRGIPKAQGRPRFARMGRFVKTYDPSDSRAAKENVAYQILQQNPKLIGQGIAIELWLKFLLPRPKGHFNNKGELRNSAPEYHTKKPDLDNLIKLLKDSLKGIVWHDDSQVFYTKAEKDYTIGEPMVEITVLDTEGL